MRQPIESFALALLLAIILASAHAGIAHAAAADQASALHDKYGTLLNRLERNQYLRPLHLDSSESPGSVVGDIHARVSYPFATVSASLNRPENWCDILILHLNVKYCRASGSGQASTLNVSMGKKLYQSLDEAQRVVFAYRVEAQSAGYLRIGLNADEGPLSTRDYRIVLEAVPLAQGSTFIRLSYSYAYGALGRLAMQAYLATAGRDKVGFTPAGVQRDGKTVLVQGMRGLVERNAMRYYLAIEAHLGALAVPPQERIEKSLRDWFSAVENYPLQLHELERHEYLDMKRREYQRQQAVNGAMRVSAQMTLRATSTIIAATGIF